MKFLYDFFPILLFFISYKLTNDFYTATAVIIGATVVQVGGFYLKYKRVEKAQLITLVLIVLLGGATLAFQNDAFMKWKPTVINWLFAAVLLISAILFKKNIIQMMMEKVLTLPAPIWSKLNLYWALFFVISGALNVYFAFYYGVGALSEAQRQAIWVDFKFYGLIGLTFAFVLLQGFWLQKHITDTPNNQ